ncbi:MAG: hypothetical protein ABIM42_08300 [candidate division WOR-3 bacterium]
MALIYEFWRYDIPTEIAKDLLNDFGIPYEEKIKKRRRDSLYGQHCDEWSKIYVREKDLVKWLIKQIDRKILNY